MYLCHISKTKEILPQIVNANVVKITLSLCSILPVAINCVNVFGLFISLITLVKLKFANELSLQSINTYGSPKVTGTKSESD